LEGVLSRPFPARSSFGPTVRVNGKIRAREVRVIGAEGRQLGILSLSEAINQARALGVDLVEVAPNATPPVCRLVDFGKFRYEQAKREKESKKHQHANKVKEIQLSPSIDAHDFKVKLGHATDFLCEEIKVKITLRFRGREMMHKEFGFQQVARFIGELAPYAHPDSEPKLIGRGITVMLSPLPRNKRAKNPNQAEGASPVALSVSADAHPARFEDVEAADQPARPSRPVPVASSSSGEGFVNNPFGELSLAESQQA
jgi:translation initiation factor IF-3